MICNLSRHPKHGHDLRLHGGGPGEHRQSLPLDLRGAFTALVGQPPMKYLTNWRMQVAAQSCARDGFRLAKSPSTSDTKGEAAFTRAHSNANWAYHPQLGASG
jgi:hypothetical protein